MRLSPDHLARAWHEGEIEAGRMGRITLERRPAGTLQVPTGRIVACDPLASLDPGPFTTTIAPGRYPVHATLASGRVAFLVLQVGSGTVASWDMLLRPQWDRARLGADEYFGYPVDAGLGCFADEQAMDLFERRMEREEDWSAALIDQMEAADWTTIEVQPDAASPLNVIVSASGLGDGSYPSYCARDAAGATVAFVTDFMVFEEGPVISRRAARKMKREGRR